MGLFVDTDWQYRGLQVVRIENEHIRVDVFPEVGAKIYNFVHKDSNRNLLWHNPRVPPARVAYGALFDDHWSGGWDELVPNDMPFPVPSTIGPMPRHQPVTVWISGLCLLKKPVLPISSTFQTFRPAGMPSLTPMHRSASAWFFRQMSCLIYPSLDL